MPMVPADFKLTSEGRERLEDLTAKEREAFPDDEMGFMALPGQEGVDKLVLSMIQNTGGVDDILKNVPPELQAVTRTAVRNLFEGGFVVETSTPAAHNQKVMAFQQQVDEVRDKQALHLTVRQRSHIIALRDSVGSCDLAGMLEAFSNLRKEKDAFPPTIQKGGLESDLLELIEAAPEGILNGLLVCFDNSVRR